MTKKSDKNLQGSKKSSTFAPGIVQDKSPDKSQVVFEVCSATPCDAWKPKEAMSIREMLIRTDRGQRLDVHTRFRAEGIPDNMYQAKFDAQGRMLPDEMEETFDHTPPDDVADIVDVIRLQEETDRRKEELRQRRSKKSVANADEPAPKPKEDPGKSPESREALKQATKEHSEE